MKDINAWAKQVWQEVIAANPAKTPKGIAPEKVMAMMNYLVDDQIMNAAIGLDPAIRPGAAVTKLMMDKLDQVAQNFPKLMTKMTKAQLQ